MRRILALDYLLLSFLFCWTLSCLSLHSSSISSSWIRGKVTLWTSWTLTGPTLCACTSHPYLCPLWFHKIIVTVEDTLLVLLLPDVLGWASPFFFKSISPLSQCSMSKTVTTVDIWPSSIHFWEWYHRSALITVYQLPSPLISMLY